ncbi:contractile injection system tape measure protein [Pseudomonas sp. GCM10022186]|uniref:contractile injection system tape measure protein n=1 Tax=Pseudomonas sp. GCM10022186 TaxID=3252650 RepID=UPI00361A83A5
MTGSEHRIGRLVFDLAAPDPAALGGFDALLRNRFDALILPALQAALDRIDRPGELIRFDRVEIDLGAFDPAALDGDELVRRLARQLAAALVPPPPDSDGPPDTEELLAFLHSGELPWVEPGKALAILAANLLALDARALRHLAERLRPLLIRRSASERLARQLPAALLRRLLRALLPDELALPLAAALGEDAAMPGASSSPLAETQVAALSEMFRSLAAGIRQPELADVIGLYIALDGRLAVPPLPRPSTRLEPAAPPVSAETNPTAAVQATPRPVHAAGAVLLHPFLATFFERLDLLAGPGRFRDYSAQCRAVLLGHYLAIGTEDVPEPETALFKLLCGLPFNEPLPRRVELSEREREEADALLRSVIQHWGRLGNTSPAGLREGFLTRAGRLQRQGENWLLSVEPSGVDILLSHLPWTLSRVRTPFMQSILSVDWRQP